MLVHRLPAEDAMLCGPMHDLSPYTIDPIRQVDADWTACAFAVADLTGVACLASGFGGALARFPGLAAALAIWLLLASIGGLYRPGAARTLHGLPRAVLLAFNFGCWMMLPAFMTGGVPPGAAARHLALGAGAVALWVCLTRLAWSGVLRALLRRGFCLDRALVVASSLSAARNLAAELERRADGRFRVVASVPMPGCAGGVSLSWIARTVRTNGIAKVFVAERATAPAMANALAVELVGLCPDVTVLPLAGAPYRIAALEPDIGPWAERPRPRAGASAGAKRLCDVVLAAAGLVIGGPAMLLIALAIKADSAGPVLFLQERRGMHNAIFRIRKFRTMYHHLEDRDGAQQTGRDDARVTRVGRFLRKTSFDELPQLLNVLSGEMSIVGPRPHALGMKVAGRPPEALVDDYNTRHTVKPGLTGWAQVNGCRGELGCKRALWRRMALDSYYIRNWSLRLDAVIILRTAALMLTDRHAH